MSDAGPAARPAVRCTDDGARRRSRRAGADGESPGSASSTSAEQSEAPGPRSLLLRAFGARRWRTHGTPRRGAAEDSGGAPPPGCESVRYVQQEQRTPVRRRPPCGRAPRLPSPPRWCSTARLHIFIHHPKNRREGRAHASRQRWILKAICYGTGKKLNFRNGYSKMEFPHMEFQENEKSKDGIPEKGNSYLVIPKDKI